MSVLGGILFIIGSTADDPKLRMVAIYAATGGVEFVIQAWLLARRRGRPASPAGPIPSAS